MSYVVLARKYRPRVFAEVVGQEVSTQTLRGAILEGRVGHAYLFTGPRGTGKTTTARIFAKALNCEKGPRPDPCGECERCLSADKGSEADIVEIDAASNTGVDNVRELREQAAYLPLRARFKVYIIDEVHMLSKPAFNALLKTLEEPPPHVKFLFATTEFHKVLETIVSRCQVLRLSPLPERTIADRLQRVFESEGVKAESGVTQEIARRARGGMRDALSLADQLLSLVGNEPALADLDRLSGETGVEALDVLLDMIEAHDAAGVIGVLSAEKSGDGGEGELLASLLDHLRGTLLVRLCGADNPLIEAEPNVRERMRSRAARLSPERLQSWLEELLCARERMRNLPGHAGLILELALVELCKAETTLSLAEIAQRLIALEKRLESAPARAGQTSPDRSTSDAPVVAPVVAPALAPAGTGDVPTEKQRDVSPDRTRDRSSGVGRTIDSAGSTALARERPGTSPRLPSSTSPDVLTPAPRVESDELWNRFLDALALGSSSLADVLRQSGKLTGWAGGRATIKLANLTGEERLLLSEPRNLKTCSNTFSRLVGASVEVELDQAGTAPKRAARAQRESGDAFTGKVHDLFGGRIEDDA